MTYPRRPIPDQTPPLGTIEAIRRHWLALLAPLGFGDRCLWLLPLFPDGRPVGILPRVDGLPLLPEARTAAAIAGMLSPLEEVNPGGSTPMLLSRPGPVAATVSDTAWVDALHRACGPADPRWPIFIAGDDDIVALPADNPMAA